MSGWNRSSQSARVGYDVVGAGEDAAQLLVLVLDGFHGVVNGLAEIGAFGEVEEVTEAGVLGEVHDAAGLVVGLADLAPVLWPASSAAAAINRQSAYLRKIRPSMGTEYSDSFKPELARSSSAESQRRFSMSWISTVWSGT